MTPFIKAEALSALSRASVQPAPQSFSDYVFGSLAADNVSAPFEWRTEILQPRDLRPGVDQVENQGSYNECVGEAWSTVLEVFKRCRGITADELSALEIYYIARAKTALAIGQPVADEGTSATTAAAALTETGVCTEALWPSSGPVNTQPNAAAMADAALHKVGRYERCGKQSMTMTRSLRADILTAVSCGFPVVICLPLAASFFSVTGPVETHPAQWEPTYVNAPNSIGNHAMAVIAWRVLADGRILLILQNSWGPGWGDGGFFGILLDVACSCAFDVIIPRSFDGIDGGEIPLELYRWTAACTLRDGRRVSIDVAGAAGQAFRVYQAAFCREPDAGGLAFWTDRLTAGASLADVAAGFASSPEFASLYGALSNDSFVRQLYRNVLHREGDESGVAFWTGTLNSGANTRAAVLQQFSESAENVANTRDRIARGVVYGPQT